MRDCTAMGLLINVVAKFSGCGLAAPRSITTCAARPVDAKVMEAPSFAGSDEAMRKAEYRLNRSYIGRFWDWLTTETLDEPVRDAVRYKVFEMMVILHCRRWLRERRKRERTCYKG